MTPNFTKLLLSLSLLTMLFGGALATADTKSKPRFMGNIAQRPGTQVKSFDVTDKLQNKSGAQKAKHQKRAMKKNPNGTVVARQAAARPAGRPYRVKIVKMAAKAPDAKTRLSTPNKPKGR